MCMYHAHKQIVHSTLVLVYVLIVDSDSSIVDRDSRPESCIHDSLVQQYYSFILYTVSTVAQLEYSISNIMVDNTPWTLADEYYEYAVDTLGIGMQYYSIIRTQYYSILILMYACYCRLIIKYWQYTIKYNVTGIMYHIISYSQILGVNNPPSPRSCLSLHLCSCSSSSSLVYIYHL